MAADNGRPWRPFIPDSYGAHGRWVLNARNALDSRRTGERGGGQHPAYSVEKLRAGSVFGVSGGWLLFVRGSFRVCS